LLQAREIKEAFEDLECHFSFIYLVSACLEALKNVLPAPLVVQAHIAWYTLAQAPHSQDNGGEWAWFTHCVLDLMGFPLDDKAMVMILISSTRCFLYIPELQLQTPKILNLAAKEPLGPQFL